MPAHQATLAELVRDVAQRDGTKPAIIFQDTEISYAALDAAIERAANGLVARGIGHGDRVGMLLPNLPQFVIAYYAVQRIGGVVVPINVLYKAEEIAYVLSDSEARALFVYEGFYPNAAEALPNVPSVANVFFVGTGDAPPGTTPWSVLTDGAAPERAPVVIAPDDLATICYTSGTTGRSKGAMLSHRNFLANCEQCDRLPRCTPQEDDRALVVLPLFHIYGMNVCMTGMLRIGATMLLIPRFEATQVLEQMQNHRCTVLYGAPPMFVAWVNHPDLESFDLSLVRFAFSGAAALPVQVLETFRDKTGVEIVEGYGLTEASPVSHSNAAGSINKPGTIGPAIPDVAVRLVDNDDCDVPTGTEGEILLRGENIMVGYWRNPEATAEALRGGWFHTGDIATVDDDGYYTVVDRKKDMINAGGFKIWPREVEEVLYRHPAVQEAAVVAIPDAYTGERPMAFVALKDGQSATADDLIAYCRAHLATFKAPRQIEFRPELPKLSTGKILRRALRDDARNLATVSGA
ncbi:MAG: long-chain fatty acid--CoA ligase [Thermomicrobia bacterium]|nr:long-chain fatty acid--CoA ligase [Thermomicrobia bacterium]